MSEIPEAARAAVRTRAFERCERCSAGGATDIHHRVRRREGGHGIDNLVLLCRTCHNWCHANPMKAREMGFIVPAIWAERRMPPLRTWRGWVRHDSEGGVTPLTEQPVWAVTD